MLYLQQPLVIKTLNNSCRKCNESTTSLNAEYEICDDGNGGINLTATVFGVTGPVTNVPNITVEEYIQDFLTVGLGTCD